MSGTNKTNTAMAFLLTALAVILIGGLVVIPVIEVAQASECKKQDGCIKVKVKKVKPPKGI